MGSREGADILIRKSRLKKTDGELYTPLLKSGENRNCIFLVGVYGVQHEEAFFTNIS